MKKIAQKYTALRAEVHSIVRSLGFLNSEEEPSEDLRQLSNRLIDFCDRYRHHFVSGSPVSNPTELPLT